MGMTPIAGLPRQVWSGTDATPEHPESERIEETPQSQNPKSLIQNIKYQRVYHLNTSNALTYDDLTYPRLSQRWQQQPPKGELLGISAAVEGSMVGFVIAERLNAQTAEIISLFVLPEYRRQGIGTKLLTYLEQEMRQQKCSQLTIVYEPNPAIATVLEPLLQKLGWQSPVMVSSQSKGSCKSLGTNRILSPTGKSNNEPLAKVKSPRRQRKRGSGFRKTSSIQNLLSKIQNPHDAVRQQFAQGKQQAQQGNLEAAVSHFQAVLSQQPDYIPALNQLGNAFQALGRFEEAIACYQKILDLNPTVAPAHCNLGSIWQLQGQPEKAISAYQKAIELEPNLLVN
jgi:tetratricopeptide (TPR) repeat protein